MTNVDFAFSRLPLDLVLLVVEFAAAPSWGTYECGPSLCLVSKTVRRAALSSMLHTLFLPRKSVSKLATALRMQRTFAQTNSSIFVNYAPHVSKVWISQYPEPPPPRAPSVSQSPRPASPPSDEDDLLPLVAPVILGATSLLFDDASAAFICNCLAWVWHHHASVPSSPSLPWRTQKLALHGQFSRWLPFTSSPEGSAFFASIRSLAVLPESTPVDNLDQGWDKEYWGIREAIPLQSFHNLRKLVVPLISFGREEEEGEYVSGWRWRGYVKVNLLVMEAPVARSKSGTRQWVDGAIDAYLHGDATQLTPVYPRLHGVMVPSELQLGWECCWPDKLMDD